MKKGLIAYEQAQDAMQQIIVWKTVEYSITILGCIFLFIIAYRLVNVFRRIAKQLGENTVDYISDRLLIVSVLAAIIGTGLFFIITSAYELIKVIFAPKIFLIEYTTNILSK